MQEAGEEVAREGQEVEEAVVDERLHTVPSGSENKSIPRPGDRVWSMYLKQEVVFVREVPTAHWLVKDQDGKGHTFPVGSFR